MGLQTDGRDLQGQVVARMAIFSIWNATSAQPGPGATCGSFGNEGGGLSCRRPYPWVADHDYEFVIGRAASGASNWNAYLVDRSTGATDMIGQIAAPAANTALTGMYNFIEHFGGAPCSGQGAAAARFGNPRLNANVTQATAGAESLQECPGAVNRGPGGVGMISGAGSAPSPPAPVPITAPVPIAPPPLPAAVPPPPPAIPVPVIVAVRVSRHRFAPTAARLPMLVRSVRRGRGGTRLSLSLSRAASVRFELYRRGRTALRLSAIRTRDAAAGVTNLLLTGRDGTRRPLRAGRYRLVVTIAGSPAGTSPRPIELRVTRVRRAARR